MILSKELQHARCIRTQRCGISLPTIRSLVHNLFPGPKPSHARGELPGGSSQLTAYFQPPSILILIHHPEEGRDGNRGGGVKKLGFLQFPRFSSLSACLLFVLINTLLPTGHPIFPPFFLSKSGHFFQHFCVSVHIGKFFFWLPVCIAEDKKLWVCVHFRCT